MLQPHARLIDCSNCWRNKQANVWRQTYTRASLRREKGLCKLHVQRPAYNLVVLMLLLLLSSFSFSIQLFPYRKSAKLPDVFLLCKVYYVCPLSGPLLAQSDRVWKKKKKKKTGWKRMYVSIAPLYSYHLPPPHHHHRKSLPKCFHHLYPISWIVAPTPSFFSSSSSVILSILFFLLSFTRPRSSYYTLPTVQAVNRQDKTRSAAPSARTEH